MHRIVQYSVYVVFTVVLLTSGCTGRYFRDAEQPPVPQAAMDQWPIREYWTVIVFNGNRIGFSHFTMSPAPGKQGLFDIQSEAHLRTRFLWMDKTIHLQSFDRVHPDLTLQRFRYDYNLDGNRMTLEGHAENGTLVYSVHTRGQTTQQSIVLERPVYPASATGLYPLLQGLRIGNHHRYDVFDGQTQLVEPFEQEVVAYEQSDLYSGTAFRIIGRYLGRKVTTWMDADGYPLLEMSMGGVIIAALEDEDTARRSLAQAALNKEESLIDFSRIPIDRVISDPDRISFLQVRISGIPESVSIPSDFRQRCKRSGEQATCHIDHQGGPTGSTVSSETITGPDLEMYLQPTTAISARHPRIQELAEQTTAASANRLEGVRSIVAWQRSHIRQEPVDVFTAMDVLETGKAECQGHALLFAALARSADIPTRVVNGIVYVAELEGFFYHTWNESYVGDRWVAVDPTFGQVPADATHIKLVEGHELADLMPLVDLIGRIRVRVLAFE